MGREPLVSSAFLSLCVHLSVLLGAQLAWMSSDREPIGRSTAPLSIELLPGSFVPADPGETDAAASGPADDEGRTASRPPAPRKPARPETLYGVKLATAADIEKRRAELDEAKTRPPPRERPTPPEIAKRSPAETGDASPSGTTARPTAAEAGESSTGGSGKTSPGIEGVTIERVVRYVRPDGRRVVLRPDANGFRPDTPGYQGRIFAQVSVPGTQEGTFFDRIHLFREDDFYRDYSGESLFGYSFRHEFGRGGVREFQVGRVRTHGAYLLVTDLFPNGRISTMGHTVILAFPREAPAERDLYQVVEESFGDFRLRGPGRSWFLFDGRSGRLRDTSGFRVRPPGYEGTPPGVTFRGLHVRIRSVGGNPFLRGRAATVVDGRGTECRLSTADLFAYPKGRRESDMFRFETDREFFSFLGSRCPHLDVPRPPEVEIAERRPDEPAQHKPEQPTKAGGLFGALFGGG